MLTNWQTTLARLGAAFLRAVARAAGRFPVAAVGIFGIALLANLDLADRSLVTGEAAERSYASLYGVVAAAVIGQLVAESRRWPGGPLLSLALAAVAALLVWFAHPLGLLPVPLLAALTLAVPLAPFAGRGDGGRFWSFTVGMAVGCSLAFLSVLLFVVGVSAIVEMVRFLFGVGLGSETYEHIYATALLFVGPLFALGRVPRDFDEPAAAADRPLDRVGLGVKAMIDWVAAPLILATALVVHLYAGKIALSGTLPINEVGWIVSLFVVLVVALRIAADPFLAVGGPATRAFGRLWAVLLVVPALLLGTAAAIRIGAEGVTPPRYALAAGILGIVLILVAQLARRSRGDVRLIAGIPVVLLALSAVGPWGAAAVTVRSQMGRLEAALAAMGPDGAPGDEAARRDVRSRIAALDDVQALPALLPQMTPAARAVVAARLAANPADAYSAYAEALGVMIPPASVAPAERRVFSAERASLFDVAGYDLVLPERAVPALAPAEGNVPALWLQDRTLMLAVGTAKDRLDLGAAIAAIAPERFAAPAEATPPATADLVTEGGRHVRLRITHLFLNGPNGAPDALVVGLALRRAEWPGSLGGDGL